MLAVLVLFYFLVYSLDKNWKNLF